jgi:hypothetical protein
LIDPATTAVDRLQQSCARRRSRSQIFRQHGAVYLALHPARRRSSRQSPFAQV